MMPPLRTCIAALPAATARWPSPWRSDTAVPRAGSCGMRLLPQADFDALQAAGTYLNVHTPLNPGGEIRGQVVPAGHLVFFGR